MGKGFSSEKIRIPTRSGEMKLLILKPEAADPRGAPGVLWIHGGGYISGMTGMIYFSRGLDLVKEFGAVVVTPDYRLAPGHPYPAAFEDCCDALVWLKDHAADLGVRSDRIIVGGESAGGGLAAAVCLYARDSGCVNVAFQIPLYPMIDDRDTASSRDNHLPLWTTFWNHRGWKAYLGSTPPDSVPCYAAPARCEDFSGLPPLITFVGDAECFYCETLAYADSLRKAGVPAVADVYHAPVHGFDMLLPFLKVSKKAVSKLRRDVRYALDNYFAPQNPKE